ETGRLALEFEAGRDGLVHVLAAGALGLLTVHRAGDPACLAFRLTRGELIDDDGIVATPQLRLPPGGRYQLTLSGEWYADSAGVESRRPPWFPDSIDLSAGDEPDFVIEHPDAAIRLEELGPWAPSRVVRHEVVEATSRTRVDVAFVAEAQTYAAVAVKALERGYLVDAAEAVCVHRAMTCHGLGRDEAIELIEDHLADPGSADDPLRAIVLIRSAEWAGGDRLIRAAEFLAGVPTQDGVPLAWLTLWMAQQLHEEVPDVAATLARLSPGPSEALGIGLRAELALLMGPDPDPVIARQAETYLRVISQGGPGTLRRPGVPAWRRAIAVVVRSLGGQPEPPELQGAVRRLIALSAPTSGPGASATTPDGLRTLAWLTLRPAES
ncbi:MAG: hypothetical protein Q4G46_14390, partial [Propionibacteriaceae bacterium]|nr:hypothetical protein [Propionibacteriaceae bacterium]